MDTTALMLGLQVALAACFSFGGITVVLAELNHDIVVRDGLLTGDQFAQSYALSTAAPGPNGPIFMALIGWTALGLPGLIACVVGWAVPTLLFVHWLGKFGEVRGHPAVSNLLSVLNAGAVGLVLAGALSLVRTFDTATPGAAAVQGVLAAVALVAVVRGWLSPLQVLGGCIVVGAILL